MYVVGKKGFVAAAKMVWLRGQGWKCLICGYTNNKKNLMARHVDGQQPDGRTAYECGMCIKRSFVDSKLQENYRLGTAYGSPSPRSDRPTRSTSCEKRRKKRMCPVPRIAQQVFPRVKSLWCH